MTPFNDIGRMLRDVYEQNQRQPEQPGPDKSDVTRLAGGLWSAFKFEEAAAKYTHRLEEQYGFLHILGHHKPVPLAGVFTDVYLYDRPLALRRLGVEELEVQFRERQTEQKGTKRIDGLSLVQKERRLFILGQPGAGKTTFLKHIALQVAKGELPGVPIFISLKALADSEMPLLDFITQEMRICGFPESAPFILLMLQAGKLLLLLDGLDEVTQTQEAALKLTQGIENVIRQYADNRFLITCRTAVTDYQFPGFTSVEMADFSPEQVKVFIKKWFQHDLATTEACLLELAQSQHGGLRDLARTPLLLNLLCLTYDELGHFPQRRVSLYEEALNALLVRWDGSRRIRRDELYKQLDLGRKRHLLARIAATTFGQDKYFIPKNGMVRHILDYLQTIPDTAHLNESDGEAVLRAIEAQHGILVERARGVYGFAHLTFQEYFTAKYVAEVGERSWGNLLPHCAEAKWREVFLLTTSLLGEADDFFLGLCGYLDQWVRRDSQLLALLAWANGKANHARESAPTLILQRYLYIYLALALARVRDHNHDLTRDRGRALALAYDLDLALALTLDRARTLALALNLAHTHHRTHDLARDLDPLIALDFSLVYGWLYGRFGLAKPFIELARQISREQSLTALHKALERLVIPDKDVPVVKREQFTQALWLMAQQERQLQVFELTKEQTNSLADYLQGTTLLVECLKLAAVTGRMGIMARLLAPPPSIA